MEIKVQCECGTKFKFDIEPVHGRMPMAVNCPECASDRTAEANQFLAQSAATLTAAVTHSTPVVRLTAGPAVAVEARAVSAETDAAPAIRVAPPAVRMTAPVAAPTIRVAPPAAPALNFSAAAPTDTPAVRAAAPAGLRIARSEPVEGTGASGAEGEQGAQAGYAPSQRYAARTLLERTTFFIKERVAVLKLTDTYDILDPANGATIGIAKEEPPTWAKFLRLVVSKHKLPTAINIYETENAPPTVSVRRGFTFFRSKLQVVAGGKNLGYFKSKLISIGGGFLVFDAQDQQVAEVKGDWKGWNFRFLNKGGREIGTVTKKWAGLGKELFTSADNYIISINDPGASSPDTTALLLAAGLSIDVVYKEND
jgi:uncharacterized protein YxjI